MLVEQPMKITVRNFALAALTLGCLTAVPCPAQTIALALPEVTAAAVPFYPRNARAAHIEGSVHLQVRIVAGRVVSLALQEESSPMLIKAAEDNVKTWQFGDTDTLTFETTFYYKIRNTPLPKSCDEMGDRNDTVALRFPESVEISTPSMWLCDPGTLIRRKQ
jgi:hypothetical protein